MPWPLELEYILHNYQGDGMQYRYMGVPIEQLDAPHLRAILAHLTNAWAALDRIEYSANRSTPSKDWGTA